MKEAEIKEFREKLESIAKENRESAKDNALRYVLQSDEVAHREAITCTVAGDSYEAVLKIFNEAVSKNG